eukprot:CAMPEP_0194110678 /NCGR_PEP_ID=MMETSP0150-20130528/9868_1 /TAXON_ID=122233 /ORGANISM="Chaetoceros debilis, Strain MM31A-1" /LENGTH=372 /DNA_ID=CAMNT_0038799917 /DNA_START=254 /DNA_END=1369 /DNA_ORIENTATION=-
MTYTYLAHRVTTLSRGDVNEGENKIDIVIKRSSPSVSQPEIKIILSEGTSILPTSRKSLEMGMTDENFNNIGIDSTNSAALESGGLPAGDDTHLNSSEVGEEQQETLDEITKMPQSSEVSSQLDLDESIIDVAIDISQSDKRDNEELDDGKRNGRIDDIETEILPTMKPIRSIDLILIPLARISSWYKSLTKNHYHAMAFFQAGVIASTADIITQCLDGQCHLATLNYAHIAAMATVASIMGGYMNAVWLRQLEEYMPGTSVEMVAGKTFIHVLIPASIINAAYLLFVPILTSNLYGMLNFSKLFNVNTILMGWKWDEFVTLTKLEMIMFVPYNILAFKFIPPNVRPLTHAIIGAMFNIGVSAVTLGYYDSW